MPAIRTLFFAGAVGALIAAQPAKAGGPNVAVCMTLANAYNTCVVEQQSYGGGGWGGPRGYGGGYGQGYPDDGDWDDEDYAYWRAQRRAARANRAQAACMSWLVQMKAANCY
ncbi:MAG: hypothetical protein EKK29_16255 [Hyphomicrobiales bacterium]|jgi:hypothetical protein|nr:MAG: hypothetical protein EKK29_16255 [Hyphomicrobiales bacterium]